MAGRWQTDPEPTREQVCALADAISARYRALVLLSTFAGLRWGELIALRRRNLDLEAMTVRIEEATVELKDGSRVTAVRSPTPAYGRSRFRRSYFLTFDGISNDSRSRARTAWCSSARRVLRCGAQNLSQHWQQARTTAGVPEAHFHDLRHAGNTMAAATGVSLRELMSRMGHTSTRAALIYQHATRDRDRDRDRDRAIADALSNLAEGARQGRTAEGEEEGESQSGT